MNDDGQQQPGGTAAHVALLDAIPEHAALIDATGRIIAANSAWRHFVQAGEMACEGLAVGASYLEACRNSPEAEVGVREVLGGRSRRFSMEYSCHSPSQERWFRRIITTTDDGLGGALVTHVDITELHQIRERLQSGERLLDIASRTARIGGFYIDLSTKLVYLSDQICVSRGFPVGSVIPLSEGIADYTPRCRGIIDAAVKRCAEEGVPYDLELEVISRQGNRMWVRTLGEPVRDESGAIVRVQGAFQDIDAVVQARDEVRKAQERLSTTLETISDAFLTVDREWRITFVNDAFEQMVREPRARLLGRVFWEALPDVVGTVFEAQYRRAVRENVSVSFESGYAPLDLWVRVHAYPTDEGLAVYVQDITAQRAAERQRLETEERFRLVASATSDAIWDWDLKTDSIWWSAGSRQILGRTPEELGSHFSSWTTHLHPRDRGRVVASLERVINSSQSNWTEEYQFQRSDGIYVVLKDQGFVMRDEQGMAYRMVGGISDVTRERSTDRRLAEQAALLDEARDAILVRQLDHTITYWNRSAERLYGWSAQEVIGRTVADIELYEDLGPLLAATEHVVEHGEWAGELTHVRKDGSTITIEGRWTLVRDEGGQPHRILAINTDVTEKKKLLGQFLRAQRMEGIGTLAGGIAHDLNNILTPIMVSMGPLRLQARDDETRSVLADVEAVAQRGAEMVQQILTYARGTERAQESIDVRQIVRAVEKIVRETFPRDISLSLVLAPDVWSVTGDATQLYQVLINLCINARDAMPDGGSLRITVENTDLDANSLAMIESPSSSGRHVGISVEDSGAGMASEVVRQIFDPFFTTKELGHGTGLGLATVQSIVRNHGGFVSVASTPGAGSTFTVILPAHQPDAAREQSVEVEARQIDDDVLQRGDNELVLLVDDEPSIRTVTSQLLRAFGYQVVTASNGAGAIAIMAQRGEEIDVILTDMMMPIMDGPTSIRVIRRMRPRLPIVAASGLATGGREQSALEAGANEFIQKPFTASAILEVLHRVLHRPS